MSHSLTIPLHLLESDLRVLLGGSLLVDHVVTICRRGEELSVMAVGSDDRGGRPLRLRVVALPSERDRPALPPGLPREIVAVLAIGLDAVLGGRALGWVRDRGGLWDGTVRLRFPGPGMAGLSPPVEAPQDLSAGDREKWSRTIAALGEPVLATMSRLAVGLVGLGRLGGSLLRYLASLPVGKLVLVDNDLVQRHNLGEGGFFGELEIGQPKVEACARQLALWREEIEVEAHDESVTHRSALDALAGCDAVFSAPDNAAARLAASLVAVSHHLPLIDVGTRVHHHVEEDGEAMGADVRLIVPGRCLLCFGGVDDEETGRRMIASPDLEAAHADQSDWRTERRGSLHSLNLAATAAAARLWEDFLRGDLRHSAWWHLGFRPGGEPTAERVTLVRSPGRCACSLAGLGPAAYPRFGRVLRERKEVITS